MAYYTEAELEKKFGPGYIHYVGTWVPEGSRTRAGAYGALFGPDGKIIPLGSNPVLQFGKTVPGPGTNPGIPGVPGAPQIPKPSFNDWLDRISKGIDSFLGGYNQGRGNLPPGVSPPLPGGGGVPGPGRRRRRQQPQGGIPILLIAGIAAAVIIATKRRKK